MNTYLLEPRIKFHIGKVHKEIDELLDEHFTEHKYNVQVKKKKSFSRMHISL
jgi:hypothetical protein